MSVDTSSEMEDEPSSLSQTNHPSSLSRQSSTTSYFDSQDSAPLLEHAEKKRKFAKKKIAAAESNQWVAIIPGIFWDKTNYDIILKLVQFHLDLRIKCPNVFVLIHTVLLTL